MMSPTPMPPPVAIPARRSMVLFAVLAMSMVIASYVFVVVLAAACVYLPYLLVANMQTVHAQLVLLFLGGIVIAGAMLWSILPRREKFAAPGALLQREFYPRLFSELDDIAASLGEPLPPEVYLIGQVNAFVGDRGGILGFGSRRILAVGLPLFSTLSVSEFRGVLAHEFAHYYSGDTKLGPFVYKTQSAMIRTFQNIGSIQGLSRIGIIRVLYSFVVFVLKHYFNVFLRVTNFVSRKKEYRADELACLVAGAEPFKRGLRKIHGAGMAWPSYWNTEVAPVLNEGCAPAISDGFSQFLEVPEIASQVTGGIEREISDGKVEAYDTHPPLRDRLAAIEQIAGVFMEENPAPASALLESTESAESQFLTFVNPKLEANSLRRVTWDEVGPLVTIPAWKSMVSTYASLLQDATAATVPDLLPRLSEIGSGIRDPQGTLLTPQQRAQRAGYLIACALALAILETGWQLEVRPGLFYVYRGSEKLNPFGMTSDLIAGKITKDAWVETCAKLGIGEALLVPSAASIPAN